MTDQKWQVQASIVICNLCHLSSRWCFSAGEEVAFVGLIDSPNPAHPPVRMSLVERIKHRLEIASYLSPLNQLRYFAGRASAKVSANLQKWRGQRKLATLEHQNGTLAPEDAGLLNVLTVMKC